MASDIQIIYEHCQKIGFDLVGICDAETPTNDQQAFLLWLKKGHHGNMNYLARDPEKRYTPQKILPGAQSIIMVALNYANKALPAAKVKIGQYAQNKPDYHLIFEQKLQQLSDSLTKYFQGTNHKFAVDYGPLMERSFATKAQLGFIGKNTTLITKQFGSWVLLGEIITTAKLPVSAAQAQGSCGSCTKCLTACPTEALKNAYELDSNLCISYLTIENKGDIPLQLRDKVGTWLFGCDICQDVCPHNIRAKAYVPQNWSDIHIAPDLSNPDYTSSKDFLIKILTIPDQEAFKQFFANTPFLRAKRTGLIRNACVVAGNLQDKELLPYLEALSTDQSELIQEHAKWAIEKIQNAKFEMQNF